MGASGLELLLQWDCRAVRYVHRRAKILRSLVNRDPRADICTVVYLFAIIACFEIGWQFFWIFTVNLVAAFGLYHDVVCGWFNISGLIVLQQSIEAKRPVDYDPRLRPTTEIHPYSYGFPSIESTMAVIVFLSVSAHYRNFVITTVCVALIALVGLSRVYTRSRFVHQIIGSYLIGFTGLSVMQHYCAEMHKRMPTKKWTAGHLCCTLTLGALLLAYVAIRIENNDTRWAALKRTEYIRVINDIMQHSSGGVEIGEEPQTKITPRAQHQQGGNRRPPRDSFFYLQRNLLRQTNARYDGSSYEESWSLHSADHQHFSDRERDVMT